MYRFRTINNLFGEYNELENQEIYFATQDELNDPMEGYKDIFWLGDRIVWKNFIKNYIRSVQHCFTLVSIAENSIRIEEKDISVAFYDISKVMPSGLYLQIEDELFNKKLFKKLPSILERRKSPIRRPELLFYLKTIHQIIINTISDVYYRNGYTSARLFYLEVKGMESPLSRFPAFLRLINIVEGRDGILTDIMFALMQKMSLEVSLRMRTDSYDMDFVSNRFFLSFEFPEKFVNKIENLLYAPWYGASFIEECSNSSVWGHYGDNHKGVCLKFKTYEMKMDYKLI